jgi:hypothetical protein
VAPTFSADHGYTGNGSTQFLNTNFTPSTAGGNYALNSASLGAYIVTSRTVGQNYCAMGVDNGSNGADMYPLLPGNIFYNEMNANSTSVAAPANAQGMYVGSRTAASGAGAVTTYRDGTSFATFSTASVSMPSVPIWIGANNSAGGVDFSADQISAAFIGGGLNSTQALALSTRINAYMTALSINVY